MNRRIRSAAMLLLCACVSSPARMATLPTDLEPKISAEYQPADSEELAIWENLARAEESIRSSPQRLIAPKLDDYTRKVVERLIGEPAPYLRIYLMRDASPNAVMLPSGVMIVNTGLMVRVRDEAQLAAVLGHEAGHYFRRHALDLQRDDRRKSTIAASASSALRSYNDETGGWNQINYAMMISSFRFSRDLESEADAYGLKLMARAGYSPRAAAGIWGQFIEERRASAAGRQKRYQAQANSVLSTHPPTERRLKNLADTADALAGKRPEAQYEGVDEWAELIEPYQAMLLQEQVYLNDPGASFYLLESLAKDGWNGVLRFYEGEAYRLRGANGDDLKAANAYAAATALNDAPPEAWRAHGFALLEAGTTSEANAALDRYLAMKPAAADAAMIRFTRTQPRADKHAPATDRQMTVKPGAGWRRVSATTDERQWEEVWTWNGPQHDRMTFIGGLPDGKAIASRDATADQQVPLFRVDMTSQDLASMLEVSYRINGVTVFHFDSVEPVDFLGGTGVRLRYNYVSGIGINKKGDCVMRIVNQKLHAIKLESLADQNFDTVVPEFEQLVAEARLNE